jgi:hypothetical protein
MGARKGDQTGVRLVRVSRDPGGLPSPSLAVCFVHPASPPRFSGLLSAAVPYSRSLGLPLHTSLLLERRSAHSSLVLVPALWLGRPMSQRLGDSGRTPKAGAGDTTMARQPAATAAMTQGAAATNKVHSVRTLFC